MLHQGCIQGFTQDLPGPSKQLRAYTAEQWRGDAEQDRYGAVMAASLHKMLEAKHKSGIRVRDELDMDQWPGEQVRKRLCSTYASCVVRWS